MPENVSADLWASVVDKIDEILPAKKDVATIGTQVDAADLAPELVLADQMEIDEVISVVNESERPFDASYAPESTDATVEQEVWND